METKCIGLICRDCGYLTPENDFALRCPICGAPMRVIFSPAYLKKALAHGLPHLNGECVLRQWLSVLPIDDPALIDRVSLGEQETPLLPSLRYGPARGLQSLHFKIEQGPSLSLKDRGTSLCVLKALAGNHDTVCVASSGNNAASVSAFGARAGLRPVVFVQKDASPAKIYKSLAYGGHVVRIDGDMALASKVCDEMVSKHGWYQCGGANPYRIAGKRTFAYGVVRQLGRAPDTLLIPMGGGAGMVAAFDAFQEMLEAGVISRMPRLVGVQLTACDPIYQAFHRGDSVVRPIKRGNSLSDAIMNANPYWGKYCLQAMRDSGGTAVAVSDKDFIRAIRALGKEEGIFAEPAGAASVAALDYLCKAHGFEDPGLTVCNITGHGLNSPAVAADDSSLPPVTAPDSSAVEAAVREFRE